MSVKVLVPENNLLYFSLTQKLEVNKPNQQRNECEFWAQPVQLIWLALLQSQSPSRQTGHQR